MDILIASPTAFAVTPDLGYGGIERLAWEFADGLSKYHKVTLLAADDTHVSDGVTLMPAGYKATANLERELDAFKNNEAHFSRFDVIHDFTHKHYIPRFGGLDVPSLSLFWHDPYLAAFPQAGHNVVALSEYARQRFKEIYFQESVVQETLLADPNQYTYERNSTRGNWYVFIGKMSVEKGALEAIEICKKADAHLVIIGGRGVDTDPDDYQKEVMRQATGKIEYLGNVSDETKIDHLRSARALIYPVAQLEISSHKSVEALMCGCPVVTYDRGAMSHVVSHGVTGFLATTQKDFIECMEKVHTISSSACRAEAERRWAKGKVIRDYVKLYEKVAKGDRWY